MSEVLEQVKAAAYASVGVNLLVTDAIVGRELPAPDFIEEHATLARKHATKALTDFRAFAEPRTLKLTEQLPSQIAEAITENRNKAWEFIGIEAPEVAKKTTKTAKRPTANVKKPTASTKTAATASKPAAAKATAPKTTSSKTASPKTTSKVQDTKTAGVEDKG